MGPEAPRAVVVPAGANRLPGLLEGIDGARGLVLFAHGSGSTHLSPRNQAVARLLHRRGLSTFRFDLLTAGEAEDRRLVFDIPLLAQRLRSAVVRIQEEPDVAALPLAYFGASTGAAAALLAAAGDPGIFAVVSRGGRPDLVLEALPRVTAPTLLLVGALDFPVIPLNRQALERLGGEKALVVVPGCSHLFEEPGGLERVADQAGDWFLAHLPEVAHALP